MLSPSRRTAVGLILGFAPVAALAIVATVEEINPDQSIGAAGVNGASGGRINALAGFAGDNSTFYAASEKGGLYKSTDGGQNWARLDRHLPNFMVDVKIDPSNVNRVIATSFYDGRTNDSLGGINVSTDGGNTWSKPASATPPAAMCSNARRQQPSAFGIAFDPDTPQNVYVGTNCGLAISTNSGVDWTFVDPEGMGLADNVWDVVVHDGGIIDTCGDQGHWRSTMGGGAGTWTTVTMGLAVPAGRCSIAASPDEANVIFVATQSDRNIWESDDGGSSWTSLGTPDGRRQGRIPFVRTNKRSGGGGQRFDVWFGDVSLFRGRCTSNPAGGGLRCPMARTGAAATPPPANWGGPFTRSAGGHDDVGDIVFDSTVAQNGCPELFASDGGVYRNTRNTSPGCHSPNWTQPNVTPHATWLFAMDGADRAGDAAEDLYFGLQDNGTFGTTNAGAASPNWNNRNCCDGFDMAAEPARVLYTACCAGFPTRATRMRRRNPGLGAGGALPDPASYPADGVLPGFIFPDVIDQFGPGQYVALTRNCTPFDGMDNDGDGMVDERDEGETPGCTGANAGDGGVFVTANGGGNPINWTELGAASEPPTGGGGVCAVYTAVSGGTPTFFVQSGSCDGISAAQINSFTGTNPAGVWSPVNAPPGGFGVFAADPNNPARLMASSLAGPSMRISTNGGTTWDPMPELDALMNGGGFFRYRALANDGGRNRNTPEVQPTLVAFDPEDPNMLIAGGRNSGVFLSADGGQDWHLVTDPIDSGNSGTPHIPRPRYAYFDHEPSNRVNVYVGSEGRGVWRVSFFRPPVADAGCPYTTDEGTPVALNGSGADADPGPLSLEWDFDGDGMFDDAVGANPVFNDVAQNGSFPIALRVTDADGAFDTDGCDVEVLNVPPTVVAGPDQIEFEDEPADLVGTSYSDPGVLDTHVATIDWGDGTPVEPGVVVPGAPGSGVVNGTHTYPDPGHYTVTITVIDSDGGVSSDTKIITVVHGFLQYCLFGLGDRPRTDRVDVRKGTFGDCRIGANARVRFKRRVELQGGARSYKQKVRVGKDNRLTGEIRAGAAGKVKRRSTVAGDFTAAADLVLRRSVTLDGDATAGAAVDVKPSTTITGAVNAGAVVPPSPPVTEVILGLAAGGPDVGIGRNETRSLAPGSYGELETRAGAVVELSSGQYRFESFRLRKDSRLRLDLTAGPVIVDVTGPMRLGRRSRMIVTSAVGGAEDIFFRKQGPGRVRLKKGGRYLGTFLAPEADLKLGRWSTLEGALYGRESNSKVGAELTQRPAIDVFISLFLP